MAGEKILTVSLPIFALPALLFTKMAEAPLLEAWD